MDEERMKQLFEKLLSGWMLLDDEYDFLIRAIWDRSICKWNPQYIPIDKVKKMIEETWEDAQAEVMESFSGPDTSSMSEKEVTAIITKFLI